jgi:hypothetical protein
MKLKNKWHEDADGEWLRVSRPVTKNIRGKAVNYGPPMVTDKNNMIMGNMPVGHGSDVTITVEHYKYKSPYGSKDEGLQDAIRLEAVRFDNLIPYDPEGLPPPQTSENWK